MKKIKEDNFSKQFTFEIESKIMGGLTVIKGVSIPGQGAVQCAGKFISGERFLNQIAKRSISIEWQNGKMIPFIGPEEYW